MKKVIIDPTELRPRTDESGRYELLLKGACPFCEASAYIARERGSIGENLRVMHESVSEGGCFPFDSLCYSNPEHLIREIMLRAGKEEINRFLKLTEDESENDEEKVVH